MYMMFQWYDPGSSDMTMWYDDMAIAYMLFALFFFCLKALFFFLDMATMRNAQTKVAIGYIWEQSCDTRDDMVPI